MSTSNLPIDYQYTIFLKTFGKNKYFILQLENIGKTLALVTMHW